MNIEKTQIITYCPYTIIPYLREQNIYFNNEHEINQAQNRYWIYEKVYDLIYEIHYPSFALLKIMNKVC